MVSDRIGGLGCLHKVAAADSYELGVWRGGQAGDQEPLGTGIDAHKAETQGLPQWRDGDRNGHGRGSIVEPRWRRC